MTKVMINEKRNTEITRYADRDEWDSDDLYHSIEYESFTIATGKDDWYGSILVPFEMDKTKSYYLVYVTYNTGDSFHREDGCKEIIGLFKTKEDAQIVADRIHYIYDKFKNSVDSPYSFDIEFDSYKITVDNHIWTGYFENLTDIGIELIKHS